MELWNIALMAVGVLVALAMAKAVFNAGFSAWAWIGMMATTIVVGLQIAPGLYSGDRALGFLSLANAGDDPRADDRYRERVRKDILNRATMFVAYPNQTARVTNYLRRG